MQTHKKCTVPFSFQKPDDQGKRRRALALHTYALRTCSIRALAKLPRSADKAHRSSEHPRKRGRLRLTEGAHADLQHFLDELALALLPRGITPNRFSNLARDAFVRAAAGNSRLRNGKVNHSKVAALTGLPRKEIRRILDRPVSNLDSHRAASMPSERVVHGWLTDPRFLTQQGKPKLLAIGGAKSEFERLVREFGGDISPRAVSEELIRSRKVRRTGDRLRLRVSKLPITRPGLGTLTRIIPTLVDGLRIASREQRKDIESLLYSLKLYAPSTAELALIRERCSSSIQSLLYGLNESLERQFTIPIRNRSSRHTLTITVLLRQTENENSTTKSDSS